MKAPSLLGLFVPALAALLPAQTPNHLVGITRNAPLLRHQSHPTCSVLAQCALPMPNSAALPPYVGGTAWNAKRSGAWVTNGLLIAQFDDNCAPMCPPAPIPTLGPNGFITGLEYVEGLDQLWMIDSQGRLHFYTNTCPPTPIGVCNTGLVQTAIGNVTTGLAVDELNGVVFISYPMFPGGPNRIAVSQLAAPCTIVSNFVAPPCIGGVAPPPFLGLACDWGNQILYATFGATTVAMAYNWVAPNIVITGTNCCPAIAVAEPMIGLAVRPGRATSVGTSCANGPCLPCPQVHTLRNDPNLGNANFMLGLDQAPAMAFAWCVIGTGPCLAAGVTIPPLCGPLHTIPILGSLGPQVTGGVGPCDGTANFTLPLPIGPGLAGQVFSSQCLTLCFGGGVFGTGLSNCLSWELQGS